MANHHQLNFIEVTAINVVQMEGVILNYCGQQLSHFQDSCRLMMSVVNAPAFLTATSFQWSEACTRSMREVYGCRMDNLTDGSMKVAPEEKQRQIALSNKYMAEIVNGDMDQTKGPPQIRERMIQTYLILDQLLCGFETPVSEMFENVLRALIVQAWATFEAMTKELWWSVHNSKNRSFSRPPWDGKPDSEPAFDNRKKIRDAFVHGFNDDPKIKDNLKRQAIDPLALLRNLLVHHGGRVDKVFKKDGAYHATLRTFASLPEGSVVPFDGPMVVSVIEPAITSGYDLIASVEKWLERNP